MTTCCECGKKIDDEESCYHVEVINGTGEDPQTGGVEQKLVYCEDCYFRELSFIFPYMMSNELV